MTWLLRLAKWGRGVPVLFAHFPGPALILLLAGMLAAGTLASCVTNKLNAGTLAQTQVALARSEAGHSAAVAEAALEAERIRAAANAEIRAILQENQRAWFAQLQALTESLADKAWRAKLTKLLEDLHNDPRFECLRIPLPASFLDGVSFPAEKVDPAAGRAGSDPSRITTP